MLDVVVHHPVVCSLIAFIIGFMSGAWWTLIAINAGVKLEKAAAVKDAAPLSK